LLRFLAQSGLETRNPRARKAHIPDNYIDRVIQFARQGYKRIDSDLYTRLGFGSLYDGVGENSNNSVRVTDAFLTAVAEDGDWNLTWRKNGKPSRPR